MPDFSSLPPPPNTQSIASVEGKDSTGKPLQLTSKTEWSWQDWFFRLREKLQELTVLPALGTANQFLTVNTGATDLEYKTLSGTANQITVGYGAGTATLSFLGPHNFTTQTLNGILYGNGTSAIAATAALTNGQLLVGQTSAAPLPKTITGDWTINAAGAAALATVNASPGTFGDAFNIPQITVNAKGLATSIVNIPVTIPTIGPLRAYAARHG